MSREDIAFDYSSPAELFLARRRGRHTDYRRFATAAEAIGYAVEELRALRSLTAWMQVGDDRFNKDEIHRTLQSCATREPTIKMQRSPTRGLIEADHSRLRYSPKVPVKLGPISILTSLPGAVPR